MIASSRRFDKVDVPEEFGISSIRLERIQRWQEELVRDERLPMTALTIVRDGNKVYECVTGYENVETKKMVEQDTIYRMYSMTKPIVSVAVMILFEMGKLHISDPAYMYLGEKWKKRNMSVYVPNTYNPETKGYETRPCERTITIKHLLTHTSGITYGFDEKGLANKVDLIWHNIMRSKNKKPNLREFVDELLPTVPLIFQPGKHWWYGFNTDVLGRIVEVVSGTDLESFLRKHIFVPLGMTDTSFTVVDRTRFASCYMRKGQEIGMLSLGKSQGDDRGLFNLDKMLNEREHMCNPTADPTSPNFFQSGGGGLVGTVRDYVRFCECIRRGGGIDGVRILSRKTVQFMLSNHLGSFDMIQMQKGIPIKGYTEMGEPGMGFGLGFSVTMNENLCPYVTSEGTAGWGGAASTVFWIDPKEKLTVVFATQLRFRDDLKLPIRALLSNLVYASVIDGDAFRSRL
jgi:CubicO group peptidase (beta-lactamase class C family)